MISEAVLQVKGLTVAFNSGKGLENATHSVNLDLYPGETLGLVGESGSGKTVTALSVMGLLSAEDAHILSGEIWFRHPEKGPIDLLRLGERDMCSIRGNHLSMIFQEPMTSLNPVQRCGKQLVEGLVWHRKARKNEAKRRALQLLGEVHLPDPEKIFHAWPHELSGGQKQRVMIAMAMACKPSVLVADEPTTALDVTVQKGVLELIRKLQQEHGTSVLFITHDLGVVSQVAQRVQVMWKGEVVETNNVLSLFSQPRHPYTRALIACRPPLNDRPHRLAVVEDFMVGEKTNLEVEPALEGKSAREARHETIFSAPPVLEIKNLTVDFITRRGILGKPKEYFRAVNNIGFSVYPKETLGLVGESGCGKTTLGRAIMRLINVGSGQVNYKGRSLTTISQKELRGLRPKFQIIFQDPYASLTPGMRIGSAITEAMQVHSILKGGNERKIRAMELLERVGMKEEHFYRYPHEFSGGQRQRICIARALSLNPDFLVCDESVSALDVSVQAQVLNLLNDLKASLGLTYIFISHDLSVVRYMSDRILVMKEGRMVEMEEADQLWHNPREDYTRSLIESIPHM